MKKVMLALSLVLSSVSAFADCSKADLSGTWKQTVDNRGTELQNAGSYREITWSFAKNEVTQTVADLDSVSGPSENPYQTATLRLDSAFDPKKCTLELNAVESVVEFFRDFESPEAYEPKEKQAGSQNADQRRTYGRGEAKMSFRVISESPDVVRLHAMDGVSQSVRLSR